MDNPLGLLREARDHIHAEEDCEHPFDPGCDACALRRGLDAALSRYKWRDQPSGEGPHWLRFPNGSKVVVEVHRGPICLTLLLPGVEADGDMLPDGDGFAYCPVVPAPEDDDA